MKINSIQNIQTPSFRSKVRVNTALINTLGFLDDCDDYFLKQVKNIENNGDDNFVLLNHAKSEDKNSIRLQVIAKQGNQYYSSQDLVTSKILEIEDNSYSFKQVYNLEEMYSKATEKLKKIGEKQAKRLKKFIKYM